MSDQKIKNMVRGAIRKSWTWYDPIRKQAIEAATVRVPIKNAKGDNSGRFSEFVKCSHCEQLFRKGEIDVDHKVPVGKIFGWPPDEDLLDWVKRLFVKDHEMLQCLCSDCHKLKTKEERQRGKGKPSK